jgi:hypothetical protein
MLASPQALKFPATLRRRYLSTEYEFPEIHPNISRYTIVVKGIDLKSQTGTHVASYPCGGIHNPGWRENGE